MLKKVNNGYKVCKEDEPTECFSKKPLTKKKAERQMRALYSSESFTGGLKPLTARVGGKVLLKKKLVDDYFPSPSKYKTYVEPFVGAGAVYFYKNKDESKEVINDIDSDIISLLKGFQKYEAEKIANDVNGDYDEDDFNKIKHSKPTDDYKKFIRLLQLYRLSFFGRGLNFGKPRISSTFEGYKDRLKNVSIYNKDYKEVIKQFNSPSTFFYLDPPVSSYYGNNTYRPIDINELAEIVHSIKGKFLLSLADPKFDKKLFKGFEIIKVPTKYVGENTRGGQLQKATEYLIMNYKPKMEGGSNCGGCLGACGGVVSKFHKKLAEIGLTPDKYLAKAKELAKDTGYDPDKVMFCDKDNKLMYDSPDGMRHFGNPDYSDYIIWTWLEHKGEVPEGTADERRRLYRARATNIKGNWKQDKYSPNNLAINILW
jgi:DNA adenine methylase